MEKTWIRKENFYFNPRLTNFATRKNFPQAQNKINFFHNFPQGKGKVFFHNFPLDKI